MPNDLDRFGRVIRNLYKTAFERDQRIPENVIFNEASISETDQLAVQAVNSLGAAIADDYPTAWLRLNDFPLDIGARDNRYTDSADITRVWKDHKGALWSASPTWTATPRVASGPSLVDTRDRGAMIFKGITDANSEYLLSQTSLLGFDCYTIEFVVKIISEPGGDWITGGVANVGRTCGLWLEKSGSTIRLRALPGPVTFGSLVVGSTYHVMFVRDRYGNDMGYINGTQAYNAATAAPASVYGTSAWALTGGADVEFSLDEIAIYRTALTAAQCTDHYAAYANRPASFGYGYSPISRYYEPITFSGYNSIDDSSAVKITDKASYHAGVLDETTMWLVFRFRANFAYTTAADKTIFQWQNDANNKVTLIFNATTDSWVLSRLSAAAGATASIASTHAVDTMVTIACKLTATQISLSVNGGAWTDVANSSIPTLTGEFFDLPMASQYTMFWMAAGVGALTDAALATVHAGGNRDPKITDFGDAVLNGISFLWPCTGTSHIPIGSWGESLYA